MRMHEGLNVSEVLQTHGEYTLHLISPCQKPVPFLSSGKEGKVNQVTDAEIASS